MRTILPCPRCRTELRIPLDLGKLTVRCPRCYESFLFDPEIARLQNLEEDSKEDNPYLKSSIHLFLENLKRTLLNFKSRFKNPHLLYQTPGKKLARNFLLLLLAIGIVRTCFFLRLRICKIQIRSQIPRKLNLKKFNRKNNLFPSLKFNTTYF